MAPFSICFCFYLYFPNIERVENWSVVMIAAMPCVVHQIHVNAPWKEVICFVGERKYLKIMFANIFMLKVSWRILETNLNYYDKETIIEAENKKRERQTI